MMDTLELLKICNRYRGDAIVVPGRGGKHWVNISTQPNRDLPLGDPAMGGHASFAMGLALALPQQKIVLFDSDGDIQMGMQVVALHDEADRAAIRVLAGRPMCVDERDARDRVQLARALMEHELDVRERLEPRAEAGLRLADPFGDGAYAPAVVRVEVEDAVGLAEPKRPQHDRLRLVGPPHAAKSRPDGG